MNHILSPYVFMYVYMYVCMYVCIFVFMQENPLVKSKEKGKDNKATNTGVEFCLKSGFTKILLTPGFPLGI